MSDLYLVLSILALGIVFIGTVIYMSPLNKLLEASMSKKEFETLMEITETAVRWAEQYLSTENGERKKDEVENYLYEKANQLGLNVSVDDIDKAIESAVLRLKD